MNTRKNPLLIICIVIITFTVIVTAIASVKSFRALSVGHHNYLDFSTGWLSENGSVVQLNDLSESCTIHKEIPVINSDAVLSFNARNLDVDVFIDDVCFYEHREVEDAFLKSFYGKTAGSAFVEIPITRKCSGKTLYINIINPYINGSACKIVNMYFGDGVSIVKHDASIQLGAFCFSILILFIGIVCLVLYIPMARHKMIDISVLYLGIAAFTFGMSMITDSKMLHLVVGHETLYYTVSQMFMVIIPIPLLLFFDKMYNGLNSLIITILCVLDIIDFIAIFVLNFMGIMDYHDNAAPILLIFALSILYIGFITLNQLLNHEKENIFHHIGVLMIVIAVILDMLFVRNSYLVETSFFTRFGLAGFTCMECTQVLWKHIENYQKGLKNQIVSRLAYHDGLTDLLNRTSFIEDMEKLEAENPSGVLIALFDINELKYVNDHFGHTDGDELIVSVANALQNAFGSIGKCYRIGGDEFVLIVGGTETEQAFSVSYDNFRWLIKGLNEAAHYPVSVATGYAVMNDDCHSCKELLDEADEKMYENKRKMKELSISPA